MKLLISLAGNSQRLDGGAMFGNAPKPYWTKLTTPDDKNRIKLATRCLLVIEDERNILFETGIGAFFNPKLAERFGVEEQEHVLLNSLSSVGLSHEDIDIVVLSHLHFDHAGGLLSAYSPDSDPTLLFPNAKFIVSEKAFARCQTPHPRDKASYIPGLDKMLEDSGRLCLVSASTSSVLGSGYDLHYSDGHTPGLLLTEIATQSGPVLYCSDLIPGTPWVHLPITMGYDRYPELLIDEKRQILTYLSNNNGRAFFAHDPEIALSGIVVDDKGRFHPSNTFATVKING